MAESWVVKYAPRKPEDVVGRSREVRLIREYLEGRSKKPLLIAGPPGSGKTSVVYAAASDHEVIEVNASDARNKASIKETVGEALKQQSLFMKPRLVLVDEVDGVSGIKDRGGNVELSRILKDVSAPAILTANDAASDKLKALRKVCTVVTLDPLPNDAVVEHLRMIVRNEGADVSEDVIKTVARRAGGDLRAAINDLQTVASTGDASVLGERDRTAAVEEGLTRVFKTTNASVALPAYDDVPLNPDELMLWTSENLPREYKGADLARAYDALSKADVYMGRIRRRQYYRFYVYIYNLLTAGIALAKEEKYKTIPEYKRSERPLKIWIARNAQAKRRAIAEKVAAGTHASTKRVMQEFPYWLRACRDKEFLQGFAEEFDLDKEQVAWLKQKA